MLSYSKLGKQGLRLGNQLFQYAFLRTQAEKLGVKFYCPKWFGDEVFDLDDGSLRENNLEVVKQNVQNNYEELFVNRFDEDSTNIKDNTEIEGYFETEKCFDKNSIKNWYKFNPEKIATVTEKYKEIDFNNSIAVHLRLGDKLKKRAIKVFFYIPRKKYYIKALRLLSKKYSKDSNKEKLNKKILIFSDEPHLAKKYFNKRRFKGLNNTGFIFIEGNKDWEDLYLIAQCQDVISGASTFGWWGGYLNSNPSRAVVFPEEGLWRPRFISHKQDLIPKEWVKIKALYWIVDNYFARYIITPIIELIEKI